MAADTTWLATLSAPRRALLNPAAARPYDLYPFRGGFGGRFAVPRLEVTKLSSTRSAATTALRLFNAVDLVFFTGYALYLLQYLRRTDLGSALIARVSAGDLAFVGISGTAAIAGPDLAPL